MSSRCILQGIERLIRAKAIRNCKKYRELIQSHDKFCQLKRWNVSVELNGERLKGMAMGPLRIQNKQNMSSSFSASFIVRVLSGCSLRNRWLCTPWDERMHERLERQSEMVKASLQKYSWVRRGGAGIEKISSRNQYSHSDVVSKLNLCVGTEIFE